MKLTDLVSNLQKLAADATALVTAAASVFWYRPTDAETQTFSTAHGVSVTDLAGYPGQSPDGTWPTNTAQKPISAVTDVNDEAQLLSYASFGYRSDGHRNQWDKAELTWARGISDQIGLAQSPQAADDVISGAGKVQPEVAQYLVMTHAYQSHTPFTTPVLMTGTLDGGSTVVQAAAYVVAPPVVPPGSVIP